MIERKWKLGEDVSVQDSLLDGFTFEQLIVSLHSGSRVVDPKEVRSVVREMLEVDLQDMWFLVEKNMDEIIRRAMEGRGQ